MSFLSFFTFSFSQPSTEAPITHLSEDSVFKLNKDLKISANTSKVSFCVTQSIECVFGLHEFYTSKKERVIEKGTEFKIKSVRSNPSRIQFKSKHFPKWIGIACKPHSSLDKSKYEKLNSSLTIEGLQNCMGNTFTIEHTKPVKIQI